MIFKYPPKPHNYALLSLQKMKNASGNQKMARYVGHFVPAGLYKYLFTM